MSKVDSNSIVCAIIHVTYVDFVQCNGTFFQVKSITLTKQELQNVMSTSIQTSTNNYYVIDKSAIK